MTNITESADRAMRRPDFLIVGAAKSGTTSLYYYLRQHPAVFMSAHKEPWFLALEGIELGSDPFWRRLNPVTTLESYLDLFASAQPSQTAGEASTGYLLRYRATIENTARHFPDPRAVKIVMILREPAARAFSHYVYDLREGVPLPGFEEVILNMDSAPWYANYIDYGRYAKAVAAFKTAFERVHVILYEDLERDPDSVMRSLFAFLEVDSDVSVDTRIRANASGVPRSRGLLDFVTKPHPAKELIKPFLPERLRQHLRAAALDRLLRRPTAPPSVMARLRDLYRPDVEELQSIIGRDLHTWL